VVEMDRATRPWTFNNLDPETGRVLVTPRGPDPVLLGVRGETPEAVKKALSMVETGEKPERWAVFRTNQGTDAHLGETVKIRDIPPYSAVVVEGFVAQPPQTAPGGHVIFRLKDATGEIFCAAYEPTGNFRNTVRALRVGDRVKVYGGLRKAQPLGPRTVNLEKLEVLETAPVVEFRSPLCPRCGKRMTSMGAHKGFRCEKCKHRSSTLRRVPFPIPRSLSSGLYMPPPRAHRHLTKPLSRYGLEKAGKPGSPPRPEAFWGLGPPA
jgi:tRNA(Ile2)-agmatinylcytidine synthase